MYQAEQPWFLYCKDAKTQSGVPWYKSRVMRGEESIYEREIKESATLGPRNERIKIELEPYYPII